MTDERLIDRKMWVVAIITTLIMFAVFVITPVRAEDNPEVRKAVYGDRPLGLHWLTVHTAACVIICIPMPLCIVSSLKTGIVGADLGVEGRTVFTYLFRSWRAISPIPELRWLYWCVTLTWSWYVACFIMWIVVTTILGV